MATTFGSGKFTGTLTVAGLATLASVVITTLVVTTLTVTTLNVRGTGSGYTLISGGGVNTGNVSGVMTKKDLSGATLHLNGSSSGSVLCFKTDGSVGKCGGTVGVAGKCGPCS